MYTPTSAATARGFVFITNGPHTINLPAAGSYTLEQVAAGSSDDLELLQGSTVIDSRPSATVTGTYTINGTAGNVYTLTIDYTASGGYFQKDVSFNPGGTSGDTLIVKGNATGGFGAIEFDYSSAHNGDIKNYSDPAATTLLNTISYTGLTPLTNSGSAGNIIFNLPAGPNTATLADDAGGPGNGMSTLSSSPVSFEATTFANPTNSVTINRGSAKQDHAGHQTASTRFDRGPDGRQASRQSVCLGVAEWHLHLEHRHGGPGGHGQLDQPPPRGR